MWFFKQSWVYEGLFQKSHTTRTLSVITNLFHGQSFWENPQTWQKPGLRSEFCSAGLRRPSYFHTWICQCIGLYKCQLTAQHCELTLVSPCSLCKLPTQETNKGRTIQTWVGAMVLFLKQTIFFPRIQKQTIFFPPIQKQTIFFPPIQKQIIFSQLYWKQTIFFQASPRLSSKSVSFQYLSIYI